MMVVIMVVVIMVVTVLVVVMMVVMMVVIVMIVVMVMLVVMAAGLKITARQRSLTANVAGYFNRSHMITISRIIVTTIILLIHLYTM